MREHVSQSKKATTASFSIPSLKHRIPGFGLDSSQASPQAVPLVQPLHKLLTHDISRIPLRNPQAKLSISQPGDKYEQEADSVAQQVMQRIAQPVNRQSIQPEAMPEESELQMKPLENSTLQRQEVPEEESELQMKPMVQRRAEARMADAPDLETSINQARGGGQVMAKNIRHPMEVAFGADFSGVKVHTDGQSDQLNRSIQARAFTTGQDVFFRQGEYNPGSRGGQELLAHELTHVVQQNGGVVQRELGDKERIIQPMNKTVLQRMQSNSTTTRELEEGEVSLNKNDQFVVKDKTGQELIFKNASKYTLAVKTPIKYIIDNSNQYVNKAEIVSVGERPSATDVGGDRKKANEQRTQQVKSNNLIDLTKIELTGIPNTTGARKHYGDPDAIARSDKDVQNLISNHLHKLEVTDSQETLDKFKIKLDDKNSIVADIIYQTSEKTSVSKINVFHVGPSIA
ncbi:DUF4157 domain-containing protein [uncultured Nostoc sp.]|uniref:eCIS core domain-containing protein n=1 Tax=uncultured Nostoc sp. TaxID=340711 RepID=UPI0035CA7D79